MTGFMVEHGKSEPSADVLTAAVQTRRQYWVAGWLLVMTLLVAAMVIVGGATRLTDSGLSITEWKPVTGAIPPLSAHQWEVEFAKYKQIPEYSLVNAGMSLADFKVIYYWEWGHRLLGRVIGLAFLFPMLFFVLKGWVGPQFGAVLLGLFILGGAQGALGWYMVMSGLTERVDVSQYRLAAHLGLAVILFAALLWTVISLWPGKVHLSRSAQQSIPRGVCRLALGLVIGIYGQIILGAFVAGLRAGKIYTDWPLMNGRFFPEDFFSATPHWQDIFETHAAVQFNHRIGAYLLLVAVTVFYVMARRTVIGARARWLMIAVFGQALLGVATLMMATPIALGLLHQAMAMAVLAAALFAYHGVGGSKLMVKSSSSDVS